MESTRTLTELLLLLIAACVRGAFVEPLQPSTELLSYTDTQTRLPCHYKTAEGESVVQVTWNKELPDGTKEPIIMNHFSEGLRGFGRYADRVKFESFAPTTESSALLLPNTQESDEGVYSCHISTFPSGNFERRIKLTVWTLPISSLDPVIMVEGDPFGEVASCRAVGKPVPWLTWDTDLPGRTQNRTAESGAVSSRYFLHPLRSMNGKKLDCLVWHPGLEKPRRISNRLVVQYPPDPIISSPTSHWYVGLEGAELVCEGRGNPEPQSVIWKRKGGVLPDGVATAGEKLLFGRAIQLNDSGTYECTVKNTVGSEKTEYTLVISEKSHVPLKDNLLLIIIGTSAGVLVLVLVIVFLVVRRRNRRATKRLETELRRTRDQMDSLSRQASFRRLNSYSSVSRMQSEDYAIDSRAKYSQMSLDRVKSSQTSLGGKWGPEMVRKDEFGRPVVWSEDGESVRSAEMGREKQELRKKAESFKKNSNMSLDSGLPSSLVPLKVQQDDGNRHKEPDLGHLLEGDIPSSGDSPPGDDSVLESSTTEGYEEEDVNGSEQLSKTLGKMFYTRNGYLRPIENRNVIFLPNNVYKPQVV